VRRRDLLALLSSTAALSPLLGRAQQKPMPVIGWLSPGSASARPTRLSFLDGLAETGYVEGTNVTIEYRWAEGQYNRLPGLAADLVRRRVALIITAGATPTALAAKEATETIPIVFVLGSDPVQFGLVRSLARPGGNLTGVTVIDIELIGKAFELLHELIPNAKRVGVLVNPNNLLIDAQTKASRIAAHDLDVDLLILNASNQSEIDLAFTALLEQRAGGLLVTGEPFFFGLVRDQLIALAARHAIPTIYMYRLFPAAGGLMSYGTSLADGYRIAGIYAGRILRGERPENLPVQQSTRVELTVNLKTAKQLGLSVPQSILARADEVIE